MKFNKILGDSFCIEERINMEFNELLIGYLLIFGVSNVIAMESNNQNDITQNQTIIHENNKKKNFVEECYDRDYIEIEFGKACKEVKIPYKISFNKDGLCSTSEYKNIEELAKNLGNKTEGIISATGGLADYESKYNTMNYSLFNVKVNERMKDICLILNFTVNKKLAEYNIKDTVKDNVQNNVKDNVKNNIKDNIKNNAKGTVKDTVKNNIKDNVKNNTVKNNIKIWYDDKESFQNIKIKAIIIKYPKGIYSEYNHFEIESSLQRGCIFPEPNFIFTYRKSLYKYIL